MTDNENDNKELWFKILLGAIAILAIKSIFEDDNSKIVSKKGRKILSDSNRMNDVNTKIQESESKDEYSEIYI
jgi:hypothetical protein